MFLFLSLLWAVRYVLYLGGTTYTTQGFSRAESESKDKKYKIWDPVPEMT
jgi:hypothetical protein